MEVLPSTFKGFMGFHGISWDYKRNTQPSLGNPWTKLAWEFATAKQKNMCISGHRSWRSYCRCIGTIALKPLAVINIRGTSSDGALRRSFETFGSKETSSRGTTFSDRPVPGTLAIAMARQFFWGTHKRFNHAKSWGFKQQTGHYNDNGKILAYP